MGFKERSCRDALRHYTSEVGNIRKHILKIEHCNILSKILKNKIYCKEPFLWCGNTGDTKKTKRKNKHISPYKCKSTFFIKLHTKKITVLIILNFCYICMLQQHSGKVPEIRVI